MIHVDIDKDGAVLSSSSLAKVSKDGVIEPIHFHFFEVPGTLSQCVWEDEYGNLYTKLTQCDNTVVLSAPKSSLIRVSLRCIHPLTGKVVWQSQQAVITLISEDTADPRDPLYLLVAKLRSDLENEITSRTANVQQLTTNLRNLQTDTVNKWSENMQAHELFSQQISEMSERLDNYQHEIVVGFGALKPLIQGVTSELTALYLRDMIESNSYTYAIERNDDQVVTWDKAADSQTSSVVVSTALITSEGNYFCVYAGSSLVCKAAIRIYTQGEETMLQFVTSSI